MMEKHSLADVLSKSLVFGIRNLPYESVFQAAVAVFSRDIDALHLNNYLLFMQIYLSMGKPFDCLVIYNFGKFKYHSASFKLASVADYLITGNLNHEFVYFWHLNHHLNKNIKEFRSWMEKSRNLSLDWKLLKTRANPVFRQCIDEFLAEKHELLEIQREETNEKISENIWKMNKFIKLMKKFRHRVANARVENQLTKTSLSSEQISECMKLIYINLKPTKSGIARTTNFIHLLCKSNRSNEALEIYLRGRLIFKELLDTKYYQPLLSFYASKGDLQNVVAMFSHMKEDGIKPDHISMTSLIQASTKASLPGSSVAKFRALSFLEPDQKLDETLCSCIFQAFAKSQDTIGAINFFYKVVDSVDWNASSFCAFIACFPHSDNHIKIILQMMNESNIILDHKAVDLLKNWGSNVELVDQVAIIDGFPFQHTEKL